MMMYLDGLQIAPDSADGFGSGAISEDLDLNNLADEDNWLGRSQWPDPIFDGLINEFRVYDHPLSQTEALLRFYDPGPPAPVPLPTLIVNTATGAAAIKNLAPVPVAIDAYEIVSRAGSLNADAWNSLSDQGLDAELAADFNRDGAVNGADLELWADAFAEADPCECTHAPFPGDSGDANFNGQIDGSDFLVWQQQVDEQPGNGWNETLAIGDKLLAERFLSGATTLGPGDQVELGAPYRVSGAQDLAFRFSLAGDPGFAIGPVIYVTTGPATTVPEPAPLTPLVAAIVAAFGSRVKLRGALSKISLAFGRAC
jgi:hypothetical protein